MKLPRGATSFGLPLGEPAEVILRDLKAITYYAARRTHAAVTGIIPAGPTPNFHTAVLTYPARQITILRHDKLPLLAFAEPRDHPSTILVFADDPDLAAVIQEVSDLRILTTAELGQPLSRADLADLDQTEHQQIKYWKPDTIGQLMFNFWD
jgi:hypothetical protein